MKAGFKMHLQRLAGKEEEAVGQAGHKSDWLCFHVWSALYHSAVLICVAGPANSHRGREAETCFAGAGNGKGNTGHVQG